MIRNYNGWSVKIQQPTGFFLKEKTHSWYIRESVMLIITEQNKKEMVIKVRAAGP